MINGINVVGRLNITCGITIAARAVIDALLAGGIDVALYNIEGELQGRNFDALPAGVHEVTSLAAMPHSHTLFLCYPNEAAKILEVSEAVLRHQHIATILYWELEHLPLMWHDVLRRFDTIFAPSTLVQRAVHASIGRTAPLVPVVPTTEFAGIAPRVADQPFTFFMSFDLLSSFTRKNPMAAVGAFINAFSARNNVRFIAKIWESAGSRLERGNLQNIEVAHPNIRFIFDDMSYAQTVRMIAGADVYVSLHRSEGLGLGMLEAMSAGRPVIATDYGANTDYLNAENGMPIPYLLEPVVAPERVYQAKALAVPAFWANADSTDASIAMRELHDDPIRYERLAQNARLSYERRKADFFGLAWLAALENPSRPSERGPELSATDAETLCVR